MKQQILDLIDGLRAAVAALPEESEALALLQARVSELEAQVASLQASLTADEDKISRARADLA